MDEEECRVRGKVFNEGKGEIEMAFGSYDTMDNKDREISTRIAKRLYQFIEQEDTAVILPFSMKSHIDNFILREAELNAFKNSKLRASVY